MKTQRACAFGVVAAILLFVKGNGALEPVRAAPLSNVFTYQGQLVDGGSAANGNYDLRFRLYSELAGGGQVGPTVEQDSVPVQSGLFTVTIDFGNGIFTGDQRFLEIAVRPGSASGADPYTVLDPRQSLTASPYCLYAPKAGTAATASDLECTNCIEGSKVMDGSLSGADIADGTIRAVHLSFTPGTVTSITAGAGLTGGTITASGAISANLGTTPGTIAAGDHNHDTAYWKVGGNSGTTAGSNFLGTTDNQALELKVNNQRALRLEPNATSPHIIGGYSGNSVTASFGATISGGGQSGAGSNNRVTDNYGTVGGGGGNQAGDGLGTTSDRHYATVAGGYQNTASGPYAAIGGGWGNVASGQLNCPGIFCVGNETVGGGINNTASGVLSTIGGGAVNHASGYYATIAGGGTSDPENSATGNRVTDNYGTVGGGGNNQAGNGTASLTDTPYATVSGGLSNVASNEYATVSGGTANTASSPSATVGGGSGNTASAQYTTISGGNTNEVTDNYGSIGGGSGNQAGSGDGDPADAAFATVGGGGNNRAANGYATVGGGLSNTASGQYATVGGGYDNEVVGRYGTIAGGGPSDPANAATRNRVTDNYGTVGGGGENQAGDGTASTTNATYATVGGGQRNLASEDYATVPGGYNNTASGRFSFAAGRNATASHDGAFVWSDGTRNFSSANTNGFFALATGDFWFYFNNAGDYCRLSNALAGWQCYTASDRNIKENLAPVDGRAIVARLATTIPIQTWNYTNQDPSVRHIGPMAQDWATLGFSEKDTEISAVDANGVALAAIEGLYQIVQEEQARITALEAAAMAQHRQITLLEQQNAALEARVGALEKSGQH